MTLEEQLAQDRALRDAAWGVVRQDTDSLRSDLDQRGVAARAADRVTEKAKDAAARSLDVAQHNKMAAAAGGALLVLWLARRPLWRALQRAVAQVRSEGKDETDGTATPPDAREQLREDAA